MTAQFSKLLKRFRKQSFLDRVVVSAFVIASVIYGGTKSTNGVPPRMNAPKRMAQSTDDQTAGFNEEDLRRGQMRLVTTRLLVTLIMQIANRNQLFGLATTDIGCIAILKMWLLFLTMCFSRN